MLTIPEVELPVETDYKTLQVIEGIKRLKDLVPTIKDCRTVEEVQHIKHSCNLIQTYAQQRDLNRELVLWAQRCALICERKIGEMLIAMKERRELREGKRQKDTIDAVDSIISKTTTLKELGISPDESSDAQALASVPQAELEQIIDKRTNQKKQTLSRQAVVREARGRAAVVKPNSLYVRKPKPGRKLAAYWSKEKKALDDLSVAELEELPSFWQNNFAEYLAERKAKLEKQKTVFGVSKEKQT